MKNVDDFVRKGWAYPETLNGQIEEYKELNNRIKDNLTKKEKYDKLIKEEKTNINNNELSFKEKWTLYSIINNLINSNNNEYIKNINLLELRQRLETVYNDIHEYNRIKQELQWDKDNINELLKENITFGFCNNSNYDGYGTYYHYFIRTENELKCLCCGKTTKDYPLTEEELDFLTLCADKNGLILNEVTEEDLPLFKVIMDEYVNNRKKSKNTASFESNEYYDHFAELEEQWLSDENEMTEIHAKIIRAHLLDSQTYNRKDIVVKNPKYLSEEKEKKLLLSVEKELEKIQNINSRFKELMIEECRTAKYEILILSGEHIPTLFNQTKSEEEKTALTKAYYNISNHDFRYNSGYFETETDAVFYDCYTANSEINNRILEMKNKRI